MSKEEIRSALEEHLREAGVSYSFTEEENLKFSLTLGKNHPFRTLNFWTYIDDDRLTVYCRCPINADEEKRDDTAVYLTYVNYGLSLGNFEMDFSDGEIRYKRVLVLTGEEPGESILPTHEQVRNLIGVCVSMFRRYGKGILAVNYGNADPEEAYNECEEAHY